MHTNVARAILGITVNIPSLWLDATRKTPLKQWRSASSFGSSTTFFFFFQNLNICWSIFVIRMNSVQRMLTERAQILTVDCYEKRIGKEMHGADRALCGAEITIVATVLMKSNIWLECAYGIICERHVYWMHQNITFHKYTGFFHTKISYLDGKHGMEYVQMCSVRLVWSVDLRRNREAVDAWRKINTEAKCGIRMNSVEMKARLGDDQ